MQPARGCWRIICLEEDLRSAEEEFLNGPVKKQDPEEEIYDDLDSYKMEDDSDEDFGEEDGYEDEDISDLRKKNSLQISMRIL